MNDDDNHNTEAVRGTNNRGEKTVEPLVGMVRGVDGKLHMPLKSMMSIYVWFVGFWIGYDIGITGGLLSMPSFLEELLVSTKKTMTLVYNPLASSDYLYPVAFISAYAVTIFRFRTSTKVLIGGVFLTSCGIVGPFARIVISMCTGIAIQVVATHAPQMGCRVMAFLPQGVSCGILTATLFLYALRLIPSEGIRTIVAICAPSIHLPGAMAALLAGSELLHLSDDDSHFARKYVETMGPAGYEDARYLIQQLENPPSYNNISIVFFDRRKYIPPLFLFLCISIFQQLASVYVFMMIYAPGLFRIVGLSERTLSLCSCLMYGVNSILTFASYFSTIDDKFGRRFFIQGGIAMLLCQIIITFILGVGKNNICKCNAVLLVVAMTAYVAAYAWSWGPLGYMLTSKILPEEIQPMGFCLRVGMNVASVFFVSQFFTMELVEAATFWMHLLISGSVFFTTVFLYALLPEETSEGGGGVQISKTTWERHWFWKRFMEQEMLFETA